MQPNGSRSTFVLVHGSWHGGWCWQRVSAQLRNAGHTVYTPTLTGLGDRSHLASRGVNLDLHIKDVAELFDLEDLEDVILVGHSYAGMVITGVAETAFSRIKRLVYLDAIVPEHGQSHDDVILEVKESTFAAANEKGRGWLVPPWSAAELGVTDPADSAWLENRLRPQPLDTWKQPLHAPDARATKLPRSYIWCSDFTLGFVAAKIKALGWDFHELKSGHDAMVTVPTEVTTLLIAASKL